MTIANLLLNLKTNKFLKIGWQLEKLRARIQWHVFDLQRRPMARFVSTTVCTALYRKVQ